MIGTAVDISTQRLRLRRWGDADRTHFAQLHDDPIVMGDLGGPIDRSRADEKFDRYRRAWDDHGFGRWAVYKDRQFVGYVGVMRRFQPHPLGQHDEIGWRLNKQFWGRGLATEAARAALADVFSRVGLQRVVTYTSSTNLRSQAVIRRLKFQRSREKDFTIHDPALGTWNGLVWTTEASAWLAV